MSHFCVYVFHDKDTSVDDLLSYYDESIEMEPYVEYTKEEAIAKVRKDIEEYKNGTYAEYLKDPVSYEEKYGQNKEHIKYLKEEFPKMLKWTDKQCYNDKAKWYKEDGMVDEDGNLLTTYNPNAKWDWYEVGGRWDGGIAMNLKNKKSGNECKVSQIDMDKIETPYAFIAPNGNWIERGQMGWFGISSNDKAEKDWDKEFKEFLKKQDKSTIVTLVDCHI